MSLPRCPVCDACMPFLPCEYETNEIGFAELEGDHTDWRYDQIGRLGRAVATVRHELHKQARS